MNTVMGNGIDGDEGVMKSDLYSGFRALHDSLWGRREESTGLISSHPVSDMICWQGLRTFPTMENIINGDEDAINRSLPSTHLQERFSYGHPIFRSIVRTAF